MAKVRYANTVRIDRKPDGSRVVCLYVNESKEYFNKAVARARTARITATRRKVKISKTDKERHREKNKISGYLEANQWEYVLRVPVPNNNHAAVWRSFTEKYRYRHKYAPLQYLMIKSAGELYGVISNAPVEDGKIPMVDIEHEVLGVFNVSMIGAMERMTLQYNRTGTDKAYMNSKGLNKKTYEYINLDNIEEFELPDDALLTVGQASIVFDGGTAEENEKAVQQFLSEKKVQKVAKKYDDVKELVKDKEAMTELYFEFRKKVSAAMQNDYVKNVGVYGLDSDEIEYRPALHEIETEQLDKYVNANENSITFAVMLNGTVIWSAFWFAETKKFEEMRWNTVPTVYFWENIKTHDVIYVGQSKTPIQRHVQHLGRNNHSNDDMMKDKVYAYMKNNDVPVEDLKAWYLIVEYYKEPKTITTETPYENGECVTREIYEGSMPKVQYISKSVWYDKEEIEMAEARLQRWLIHGWKKGKVRTDIFLDAEYEDVIKAERLFDEKIANGKSVEAAARDAAKGITNLKNYLVRYYNYKVKYPNDVLKKCVNWWKEYFDNQRKIETSNGCVGLDVIIDVLRKNRIGLEDLIMRVVGSETKEQTTARYDTIKKGYKKENDMSMTDGWIPE